MLKYNITVYTNHHIQSIPGGKVNILEGHSIDHCKQNCMYTCVLFRNVSEMQLFHSTVVWILRPVLSYTPACESV
jgi:hypothetical protein